MTIIGECIPPGYTFLSFPRDSATAGGGIGILHKKSVKLCSTPSTLSSVNFEHCVITINNSIQRIAIYRPPPSRVSKFKTSEFLEEFETFLDATSDTPHQVVLLSDFNLHIDIPDKSDTRKFVDIITTAGFLQHVRGPTHILGHTLDLVISREDDDLIQEVQVNPFFTLIITLSLAP